MTTLRLTLLLLAIVADTLVADDAAKKPADEITFREPFTLKLHVDKENFYEQKIGKIPFVANGDVYLFKGDEFGLTLDIQENKIRAVRYQPDLKKADVTLKFSQEVMRDGNGMMLLRIQNGTKVTLNVDAIMTVPGHKGAAKTSILPIEPGIAGNESWPHPILQLVLRNIRIAK